LRNLKFYLSDLKFAICVFALAAAFLAASNASAADPRLEIPAVKRCVETVKEYLRSDQYQKEDQQTQIISACRNTEAECVRELGEALSAGERSQAAKFLPLVKGCQGNGTVYCFKAQVAAMPSFDRNEASEAEALLKRCE
jgi:hypothetical protein